MDSEQEEENAIEIMEADVKQEIECEEEAFRSTPVGKSEVRPIKPKLNDTVFGEAN